MSQYLRNGGVLDAQKPDTKMFKIALKLQEKLGGYTRVIIGNRYNTDFRIQWFASDESCGSLDQSVMADVQRFAKKHGLTWYVAQTRDRHEGMCIYFSRPR